MCLKSGNIYAIANEVAVPLLLPGEEGDITVHLLAPPKPGATFFFLFAHFLNMLFCPYSLFFLIYFSTKLVGILTKVHLSFFIRLHFNTVNKD